MSGAADQKGKALPEVLTVGEAMALFIAGQAGALADASDFRRVAAGAELNVAIGLSRLGFRVGYVSRLGADSLGANLLKVMQAEGIDTRFVTTDKAHPTGLMLKSLEPDGRDPSTEYFRRGSAASHMGPQDCPSDDLGALRHLHLTGIAPALSAGVRELVFEMAEQSCAAGRRVSFDPNLRPSLWASRQDMIETLNRLAASSDVVLPGLAEGRLLSGRDRVQDVADFYRRAGASQVVIKLGAEGAYYAGPDGDGFAKGVPVDKVVDTVGAGDGFAVGVISALLDGEPLSAAAMRGNTIGARVVQFPGDSDGLPNRSQLNAAMGQAG